MIKSYEEKLIQKDLTTTNLDEIGSFLWSISRTDEELAREIIGENREVLREKIASANLDEIGSFLESISIID